MCRRSRSTSRRARAPAARAPARAANDRRRQSVDASIAAIAGRERRADTATLNIATSPHRPGAGRQKARAPCNYTVPRTPGKPLAGHGFCLRSASRGSLIAVVFGSPAIEDRSSKRMLDRLMNLLRPPEAKSSRTAQLIAARKRRPRALDAARLRRARARGLCLQRHRASRGQARGRERRPRAPSSSTRARRVRDPHPLLDLLARPNPRQERRGLPRSGLRAICCSPATPMSRR